MTTLAWTDAEYMALIDRLLADLATARGLSLPQIRIRYRLPDRPPMHRPVEDS